MSIPERQPLRSGDTVWLPMMQMVGQLHYCALFAHTNKQCNSAPSEKPCDKQGDVDAIATAPLLKPVQESGGELSMHNSDIDASEALQSKDDDDSRPQQRQWKERKPRKRAPSADERPMSGMRKRGLWSDSEAAALERAVRKQLETVSADKINWAEVAKEVGGWRTPKQCRERWCNQHKLDGKAKAPWSAHERWIIWKHVLQGSYRWSVIASMLPYRKANQVKNLAHSFMRMRSRVSDAEISERIKADCVAEEEQGAETVDAD